MPRQIHIRTRAAFSFAVAPTMVAAREATRERQAYQLGSVLAPDDPLAIQMRHFWHLQGVPEDELPIVHQVFRIRPAIILGCAITDVPEGEWFITPTGAWWVSPNRVQYLVHEIDGANLRLVPGEAMVYEFDGHPTDNHVWHA